MQYSFCHQISLLSTSHGHILHAILSTRCIPIIFQVEVNYRISYKEIVSKKVLGDGLILSFNSYLVRFPFHIKHTTHLHDLPRHNELFELIPRTSGIKWSFAALSVFSNKEQNFLPSTLPLILSPFLSHHSQLCPTSPTPTA